MIPPSPIDVEIGIAKFWKEWQANSEACIFPTLLEDISSSEAPVTAQLPFSSEPSIRNQLLAKRHGEVELLLCTAWAIVLHTYTLQDNVCFGLDSKSDGSGKEPSARLCSASIGDASSVKSVARAIQQDLLRSEAYQYQHVSAVPAFRSSFSGTLFCNTAISIDWSSQKRRSNQREEAGLAEERTGIDLCFHIDLSHYQINTSIVYSKASFNEAQAYDIALATQHLLSQILQRQETNLSQLDLVHPRSLEKLHKWNKSMPESVDKCVGELFLHQVRSRPQSVAVHSSDSQFSYAELDTMTNVLATQLQSMGVGPETAVLLAFPKSAWAVVAMLSVARSGGTLLFLDPAQPIARLQEIQNQVQSKILLTAAQYADRWDWTGAEVLVVNQDLIESLPSSTNPVSSSVAPGNLLYIIFTSGSTGKPKGCCIEHRQFLTGSFAQRTASGMQHTDRVLQLASFTFDVSMLEIFTSLVTGACVCIPADESRSKGPASCIQEFGVTWAFLTPSLVKLMAPEMVPTLRFLVLGGEPLSQTDIETWAPHLQLANGYGPTECSVAATGYARLDVTTSSANIGWPLGALCWVVHPEDHRRLVPPGAPGELLVHGHIVARSYYQDPAKTEAVFLDDDIPWPSPYSDSGWSSRMYKTGDIVRFNDDGSIHFIARKDSQVKLRGLRVELGEIEHHVTSADSVQQASILLPREGPCKNQLTAVVALHTFSSDSAGRGNIEIVDMDQSPDVLTGVAEYASQHLPVYMLPSVWIAIKSIPVTSSGKLDRKALEAWLKSMDQSTYNKLTASSSSEELQAATPLKTEILHLCSDILELPVSHIILDRSFVNNGGDSITGMRLLGRLRAVGFEVSVGDMIEAKSLRELAARAIAIDSSASLEDNAVEYDMARFSETVLPDLPLRSDEIEDVYPLAPMQRGILLSQQRGSASYELRIVCDVTLPGHKEVDIQRLKDAWTAVTKRHTSLRTIFTPSINEDAPCDQLLLRDPSARSFIATARDKAEVMKQVKAHRIVATSAQPRAEFVVYDTPDHVYCMLAVDHALIDGVSVLLLLRDLSSAYSGLLDPSAEMRFSHYVGYVQHLDHASSLEYWKDYLHGSTPCHFPIVDPGSGERGELQELEGIFERGAELQQFCRDHNLTPASIVQCAWALTLRAYTGLDDVCFGYLSAGRDASVRDIQDAVGAYINMLICRLIILDSSTMGQLVSNIQGSFLKALPHQHCSLADIQRASQVRERLFNTVLSLQSAIGEVVQADEQSPAFTIVGEVDPTEYDISVNIAVARQMVHLNFRHCTSRISPAMALNVFSTFQYLISAVMDSFDQPIAKVPLISDRDRAQLQTWNKPDDCMGRDSTILDHVAAQVKARGDALAIDAWDGKLSYAELDALSTKLAIHLAWLGIGPETLVPLVFRKSVWVPVTQLAVLKAGGACVSFDPTHPAYRRAELCRQCDARIAVTSPEFKHCFDEMPVDHVVTVDRGVLDALDGGDGSSATWAVAKPNNVAFVVFTSGSTGRPKGIVLEHHSLVTSAHAHGPALKYGPGARVMQFSSYNYDVSIAETFSSLMLGATVCVPNDDERLDDSATVMNRMDITSVHLTPSVASTLDPSDVPSLQVLALGGEVARTENIAVWADKVRLVNIYAPAECSVFAVGLVGVAPGNSPSNIGSGLGACNIWITEPGNPDRLCPIGSVGEVLLEGAIVARGYLKDHEKTAAAFISAPKWRQQQGLSRMYRTGDSARFNLDGTIHYIGRRDYQIKLHGQRIELSEIEQHILDHDVVVNAVVLYPKSGRFKEKLLAVLGLRQSNSADSQQETVLVDQTLDLAAATIVEQAKTHLSERVPGYMMPSVWRIADTLPLSANGKTDRVAILRMIESLEPETMPPGSLTRIKKTRHSEVEDSLAEIIAGVLGLTADDIAMEDMFVGIGGDSITAMQVSARSRRSGLSVSVKDILVSRSLRQLAASVKRTAPREDASAAQQRSSGAFSMLSQEAMANLASHMESLGWSGLAGIEDAYPVSPMQRGLLIAQAQTTSNYKFFVVCEVTATKGGAKISADILRAAWRRVIGRHTILRTIFVESGSDEGLYQQLVLREASARFANVNDFEQLIANPWENPVDYDGHPNQPPHRFTIYESDNGTVSFTLEASHTLIDGGSMGVILKDLALAYGQTELPPAPRYSDYIALLVEGEKTKAESLHYWQTYLSGAEPCDFPQLRHENAGSRTLKRVQVDIRAETIEKLLRCSRLHGVTLANVLQTAWAVLLRTYSSRPNVLFGFLASGRDVSLPNVEEAVGPFINMLVCRLDVSNEATVLDVMRRAQSDYLDSLSHQHTSLGEIQHSLDLSRSSRLFNTILSLQRPMTDGVAGDSEINIKCLQVSDPTEYDMTVGIVAGDATIEMSINYWSTFLSSTQADRVAATFSKILAELVQQPEAKMAELDCLSETDRHQILDWNRKGIAPAPVYELISENVVRRAIAQPDRPAIESWDGCFTYGELDTLSNRLAHHLRTLGVVSETIVMLSFRKSKWAIVSMLAILRAGGAYASTDPSHPPAHLAKLAQQTQATFILAGSTDLAENWTGVVPNITVVDQDMVDKLPVQRAPLAAIGDAFNAAFISFTSGSTGVPKAICVTNTSFTSMVAANPEIGIGPNSRVFQFAAYIFDPSNADIFYTLTYGGCVCIPSEDERLNNPGGAMARMNVNWAGLTPSMARILSPAEIPTLKTLKVGGEQMASDVVDLWSGHVHLINAYGPAEGTIWTSTADLDNDKSPATISRGNGVSGNGSLLWVVDVSDINKLAPVGVVGELFVEGPILSRGYLDAEQTARAFVAAPRWRGIATRMYRTGDLVRYHDDGSLIHVGRADGQVKLNGQRIEMGEIERQISSHDAIRHATVLLPKQGICRGKLVAVVSPAGLVGQTHMSQDPHTTTDSTLKARRAAKVAKAKDQLQSQVPAYMVPSVWLILEPFPLTASQKLDRVRLGRWVKDLTHDDFTRADFTSALDVQETRVDLSNVSADALRLQGIVATVLNLEPNHVQLHKSFLNLGGDSITAMQLVVQCRKNGIQFTVKDVMRSATIQLLAASGKAIHSTAPQKEAIFNTSFMLSPIQSLYFKDVARHSIESEPNQYNQSFLLAVKVPQTTHDIATALQQVVDRHDMLRARFLQDGGGVWSQVVLPPALDSHRFRSHEVKSREEALSIAESAQEHLDIRDGPVFIAELFNVTADEQTQQLLFLVAHHLVVDLVSWRTIIRQLEEILTTESSTSPPSAFNPFPFSSWVKAQAEYSQHNLDPESALPHQVPASDYAYWGMTDELNLRGSTVELGFTLDQSTTDLLLRLCHASMKTDALDIFLAAAFQSFAETFSRPPPVIFNEGHGREPWDSQIDITETVGWFTTMFPIHVAVQPGADPIETIKLVKDQRRAIPQNGWSYWNSAHSNDAGIAAFANHRPVEIQFNYLGVYQGQLQTDALLIPQPFNKGDVGAGVQRLALIDINVYVLEGQTHFAITFNEKMRHRDAIERWSTTYKQTLIAMGRESQGARRTLTSGDFPLLRTTNDRLAGFQKDELSSIASLDNIEDIFACSPMQEGILLSQNRKDGAYQIRRIVEVSSHQGRPIDMMQLANAWQKVVDRHPTLRTCFLQKLSDRPFDQMVLKQHAAKVHTLRSDDNVLEQLQSQEPLGYTITEPSHSVMIAQQAGSGRAYAMLEISHALVDGISMAILVSEWVQAYEGVLSPLPGPLYSDYVAYIAAQGKQNAAINYWKQRLAGAQPCSFPALLDGDRHPARALREIEVKAPSAALLRDFGQQHNLTMASIFRLAWAKVLQAFTGDQQVCFGYLASGREIPVDGIDGAIGAFINMLVCAVDFESLAQQTVVDSLEDLQQDYLESLPFQHVGLAQILSELGHRASGGAFFNTVLSLQRRSHRDFTEGDIAVEYVDGEDPTEYDIAVSIADGQDEIHVVMSYFTDRLSNGQAANVASAFSTALASILDLPQARVSKLWLHGVDAAAKVSNWNSRPVSAVDKCLHQLFAENAQSFPGAIAIETTQGSMTYGELNLKATQLAHQLRAMGIRRGSLIPIGFEKSPWAIVAMLGIMKAGAGYVALDPAQPDDVLTTILTQTRARLLFASATMESRMSGLVKEVMVVSPDSWYWSEKGSAEEIEVSADDPAYVLFTHDSAGLPKGVMVSHKAVSSSIFYHGAEIGFDSSTRVYQHATFTFDACILEIFTTLAYRGTICMPSDTERASDVASFINRFNVNTSFMTPLSVRLLVPEEIPTMKTLILGSEPLGRDNVETWAGKVRLMHSYGPTEAGVGAVMKTFTDPSDRCDTLGIGVASQTWIVCLDDPTQLAPVGAVGMLHLTGPALAMGYLDDDAKTKNVFIDKPAFLARHCPEISRAYKTGDLARYNSHGSITYVGRRDEQIKLRGRRIEVAEIEHHVKACLPQALQVAVEMVRPLGEKERETLAAFFVVEQADDNDKHDVQKIFTPLSEPFQRETTQLRKALSNILPPYEVPSLYIPVRTMPMTTASQLDRRALRDAFSRLPEVTIDHYAASEYSSKALETSTERHLAQAWAEVLQISMSCIGGDDHFFRLGGDSIRAMRLVAKLGSSSSLTVSDVFNYPILSEMADIIARSSVQEAAPGSVVQPFELVQQDEAALQTLGMKCNVSVDEIDDTYPCTALQEGLMALSALNPGAYVGRRSFRLSGSIDLVRFKAAWEQTIAENALLRTTIAQSQAGQSLQVVLRWSPSSWKSASTLQQYIERDQNDEIAFGKPLSRYGFTDDGHFVWTAHHSVYDGWTVPLVLDQVQAYYRGLKPEPLPGFNSFIKYLSTLRSEDSRAYWDRLLSDGSPVTFPEQLTTTHILNVDQRAHRRISIRRQPGADIPMATILRAAWAYVLGQYSDADDIVFGVTLAGRSVPVPDVNRILGPTITTVPVRLSIPTQGSVGEFLQMVNQQATEMMPFEHFGLQNIANISAGANNATRFQNLFVVQLMEQLETHRNKLPGLDDVSETLKNFDTYPLVVECSVGDSQIHLEARFDAASLLRPRVDRMLQHFEHVIRTFNNAAATQSTGMADVDMLTEADMVQVLSWNSTYPEVHETTVGEVFAQQVQLRPDAVAVDAWDGQLTYAELNALSTALARHLVDKYLVGPEVLVPMCFEKSVWAIVTQLAIILAGGAVVNLDPAHPLSRLEYVIEDAEAHLLLVAPHLRDTFNGVQDLELVAIDRDFIRSLDHPPRGLLMHPRANPSNVAYVLFTSGSTGRPKGIIIEHRSLCSSSAAHGKAWDIGPNTRLLQFAAYTFDVSCADIFTTLQRGGCICVPSEHDRMNNLAKAINDFRCNWAFLTPTVASLLPATGIPTLRKLVLGGEASTRDTIAKWHKQLDLIVCYGPAECAIYCSGAPPAAATSDPADLGEAIGARYWIADPADFNRMVPIGCTGELLLEGPTVARGYLHDAVKTANAFVYNPSWGRAAPGHPPRKFYRTGDLVRFNEDGTIHFVGRRDTQVKIRGQRVELGEIENSIRKHMPTLAHVIVDAVKMSNLDNRTVILAYLFFMANNGGSTTATASALPMEGQLRQDVLGLQKALTGSLPSYMLPNIFLPILRVPLTMNGKADRRQLREMAAALQREQVRTYGLESATKLAPTTATESTVRDLWARVLGVDAEMIGIGDRFFSNGGDSILAMKLVGIANEEHNMKLSVRDFFRHPVLSDMAKVVDERDQAGTHMNGYSSKHKAFSLVPDADVEEAAAQIRTTPLNVVDIVPATDFQKTAVAHAHMQSRGMRNYFWLESTTGAGNEDAIRTAIQQFVSQHEILRTVFAVHQNDIVQVVLRELQVAIEVHETSDKNLESVCQRIFDADVRSPARLAEPLLKFFVVQGPRMHRIVMRISHAQYDGICLPLLWNSLTAALEGQEPMHSPKPMSLYMDTVAQQDRQSTVEYWRALLKGSEMSMLAEQTAQRSRYNRPFTNHDRRVLRLPTTVQQSSGITFATILKTAWAMTLSTLSGTTDSTFGHVVSGRSSNTESVVGACINIVPVRVSDITSRRLSELLESVQDQHSASLEHESVLGLRQIVRECTDWPNDTRFTSVVQHQNIEQTRSATVSGADYNVGFWCPPADETDVAVKSTPLKDGSLEVVMIYSDRTLPVGVAEALMATLCDGITTLSSGQDMIAADWMQKAVKQFGIVLPVEEVMKEAATEANAVVATSTSRDWIMSVPDSMSKSESKTLLATALRETLALGNKGEIGDFFELGGDLVSAVILSAKLEAAGIQVRVEDII